ncbi:MAG: rhodanese-like domain-containing protein [Deltaproteobacteria bacterium]|nr:rhodanese-like domain-containing protein [Deltaproteobacteria bacterium]
MKVSRISVFVSVLLLMAGSFAFAEEEAKGVDSKEAYKMVMDSPRDTFIVDVRTKAEYEFVGHPDLPNGVPNIPLRFYPKWNENSEFVEMVEKRYSKDKTLIMICRSGGRAEQAATKLMEAGFKKVYYMSDSFEGSKDKKGHRTVNGWKVNGLPYTHTVEPELEFKGCTSN